MAQTVGFGWLLACGDECLELPFPFDSHWEATHSTQSEGDVAQPPQSGSHSLVREIGERKSERHIKWSGREDQGDRFDNPRLGTIAGQGQRDHFFGPTERARHFSARDLEIGYPKVLEFKGDAS